MKLLSLLAAVLLLGTAGFGQSSSSGIYVRVWNGYGELVVQSAVHIYQDGREVTRCYTDDSGTALAKPLLPGTYEVRVELDGVTRRVAGIQVGVAAAPEVTVDFRLKDSEIPARPADRQERRQKRRGSPADRVEKRLH